MLLFLEFFQEKEMEGACWMFLLLFLCVFWCKNKSNTKKVSFDSKSPMLSRPIKVRPEMFCVFVCVWGLKATELHSLARQRLKMEAMRKKKRRRKQPSSISMVEHLGFSLENPRKPKKEPKQLQKSQKIFGKSYFRGFCSGYCFTFHGSFGFGVGSFSFSSIPVVFPFVMLHTRQALVLKPCAHSFSSSKKGSGGCSVDNK